MADSRTTRGPRPAPAEPKDPAPTPVHPGDARELAEALTHAPALSDWDLTPVSPVAGQGNQHQFFADDAEWEYRVKVSRVRRSLKN